MVNYSKWDAFDEDNDELPKNSVQKKASYEVLCSEIKVRDAPSTNATTMRHIKQGKVVETDVEHEGWVRLSKKEKADSARGWMLIDGAQLGLGTLLRFVEPEKKPTPKSAAAPPKPIPAAPPAPKPIPAQPSVTTAKTKSFDYSKWDSLNTDDDKPAPLPKKPGDDLFGLEEEKKNPQQEQLENMSKGFDNAAFQQDRVKELEAMKKMSPDMADNSLASEQVMRDAKQQGNQGNLAMDKDGKMVIMTDDDMGGKTDRYSWGQNEKEVIIKYRGPKGLKARDVKLNTTSRKVKLQVGSEKVCDGDLHKAIISDESTFSVEDDGDGRLVTVTLTKETATKASKHWSCVVKGEGKIDPKSFGPEIITVNPNDPSAIKNLSSVLAN
mmetsp:Transcript_75840/g.126439  ORF Transcript_75840/g.126439 Transcript_75840/m.126439 type:complete len:382 (+) Transcript_75840:52-1197(+)|eukprot:CAMPEP_0119310638 /NCGR_PEP_ID=MMETSP1333-20130426/19685_1 /TAXON_ID=418940 /ORGANISM="Scyphosphaera apsteinii, Strain RCC1455" /LENGTH=381 /DNA_ID=CAMNT_0007314855 /DNA_START=52 /DNA_END=1200 /DNA_ORIENTATION=+